MAPRGFCQSVVIVQGHLPEAAGPRGGRLVRRLPLVGHFLIIAKLEDHDIRAPILGVGREVAISRRIPILVKAASNLHHLKRTVL